MKIEDINAANTMMLKDLDVEEYVAVHGAAPSDEDWGTWRFEVTTTYRGRTRTYETSTHYRWYDSMCDVIALARVKVRPFADPNGPVDVTAKLLA